MKPDKGPSSPSSLDLTANLVVSAAVRALLYEVSATPKPGLVDRNNSGSHRDMNFFTFLDSSAAMIPWFREFFCLGAMDGDGPVPPLFSRLRSSGKLAEDGMFSATKGVNTHKGLVFSFAILCAALGKVYAKEASLPLPKAEVLSFCKELGACSLEDFRPGGKTTAGETSHGKTPHGKTPGEAKSDGQTPGGKQTAGERIHAAYGLSGARGEAALGFPSALSFGLPALKKWLLEGFSLNDAAVLTLLSLLSQVDDTNMIHRGGLETALACKKEAGQILAGLTRDTFHETLTALDTSYIQRNLSPGGCADLLAISLLFYFLETGGVLSP